VPRAVDLPHELDRAQRVEPVVEERLGAVDRRARDLRPEREDPAPQVAGAGARRRRGPRRAAGAGPGPRVGHPGEPRALQRGDEGAVARPEGDVAGQRRVGRGRQAARRHREGGRARRVEQLAALDADGHERGAPQRV
jgi:hypothetical protein